MSNPSRPLKWHTIKDAEAAQAVTACTNSPGVIYPMSTLVLPAQLQKMTGVCSYFVSGFVSPTTMTNGLTVGGELLVARVHGQTTKNYNFLVASCSNGSVHFAGPFQGYGHHVTAGQSITLNSLFGNSPIRDRHGV